MTKKRSDLRMLIVVDPTANKKPRRGFREPALATPPKWFCPAGNKLNGLGHGNDRFIAVGDAGAILVSTNGVNWTAGNSGQSALNGVANASGLFVAVGELGTILTSPDGTNWTQRTSGTTNSLLAVTYGGGEFVAVGGCDRCDTTNRGTILTSPDGVTWTPRTAGTGWILSATFTMLFMRMACG